MTPDTQAILLLCGRFGRENGVKPLEIREYHDVATWLEERHMRPSDTLDFVEGDLGDFPIEAERFHVLIERGAALALALEAWQSKGLWVIGIDEEAFPPRLVALGRAAPPILYGAGNPRLLIKEAFSLAIVGSRNADEGALDYARRVAEACAAQNLRVVSGGARGVDSEAMLAALRADGETVGVLADGLARAAVAGRFREGLMRGSLVLISRYDPAAGFNVGNAMGRNKDVYALSDAALVVDASAGEGGTWAGATEALRRGGTPVFVRLEEPIPDGNVRLLDHGALPFPPEPWENLGEQLARAQKAFAPDESASPEAAQLSLDLETDLDEESEV